MIDVEGVQLQRRREFRSRLVEHWQHTLPVDELRRIASTDFSGRWPVDPADVARESLERLASPRLPASELRAVVLLERVENGAYTLAAFGPADRAELVTELVRAAEALRRRT